MVWQRRSAFLIATLLSILLVSLHSNFYNSVSGQESNTPTPPPLILSEQVGFSDTTIETLQNMGISSLDESIEFIIHNHKYRLFSVLKLRNPKSLIPEDGMLLLYEVDNNPPLLIWKLRTDTNRPILTGSKSEGNTWPIPGDWFSNGEVLFGVFTVRDTTGWAGALLHLYRLDTSNQVTSVFKSIIPAGHIVKSAELRQNRTLLLTLDDLRGEGTMGLSNCCGPRMRRYFEWDGKSLTDVSAQYADKYYESIGLLIYSLTTWKVQGSTGQEPNLFAKNLLELMMIYEALGQREAGWMLVQNLVTQAQTTQRLLKDTYVDKIFMPTVSQLFKEDKMFVPPEYVGSNAQQLDSFYASGIQ